MLSVTVVSDVRMFQAHVRRPVIPVFRVIPEKASSNLLKIRLPADAHAVRNFLHEGFIMKRSLSFLSFLFSIVILSWVVFATNHSARSGDDVSRKPASKAHAQTLKPFNSLVGSWRGVGQLQRGSRKGAWSEKVVCEWNFDDAGAAVVLKSEAGRQFEQLKLRWDEKNKQLVLQQQFRDQLREYRGTMPKTWPNRLQLVSTADSDGVSYRCTIQQLTDIRSTLLFEKRTSPTGSFRRVAGIGYTRSGARLAVAGGNQRKCIVTGGLGTIPVTYKGETFYVCCQGCVQAFNDSPEEIIAEYRASLKAAKK